MIFRSRRQALFLRKLFNNILADAYKIICKHTSAGV
jgi:hypothetical protein